MSTKTLSNKMGQPLSEAQMNQVKGGNGATVEVTTMVEVTTTNQAGQSQILFCDRRRKKVSY